MARPQAGAIHGESGEGGAGEGGTGQEGGGRARAMTPRQTERRERILTATLEMIAERGYEAVTMDRLAIAGGVSKRALYDIYGSKEALLVAAVSGRMNAILAAIQADARGRGLVRLDYAIHRTIAAVLEFPRLSQALEPVLLRDPGQFAIREFFDSLHRRCLEEMAADAMLEEWADIDFLVVNLMAEQIAVQNFWAAGIIASEELEDFAILSMARILLPVALDDARADLMDRIRSRQDRLRNWRYLRQGS